MRPDAVHLRGGQTLNRPAFEDPSMHTPPARTGPAVLAALVLAALAGQAVRADTPPQIDRVRIGLTADGRRMLEQRCRLHS